MKFYINALLEWIFITVENIMMNNNGNVRTVSHTNVISHIG